VIVSGILHDTLEDTDISLKEISKQFGKEVSSIVKWCTTLDDESEPWKDRKKRTLESIKAAPFRAVLVAGADKLDNIRALRRDYIQIGDDLWSRFNAPKEDIKWYYSELVPIFGVYLEDCAFDNIFREYIELVSLVFGRTFF
jgi:(p)ppGpp synthase/HD superfamily hydrolase